MQTAYQNRKDIAAQLHLHSLHPLLFSPFSLSSWKKHQRQCRSQRHQSTHTHAHTVTLTVYLNTYWAYIQSQRVPVDSVLAHSSSASEGGREKWVVRYFPFPPPGFLTAVSDAEIKGYEDRLFVLPYFLFICSIYPVFLYPFVDSGPRLHCDSATHDGKLHSLSHPPLCLSPLCLSPCSIAYLLGFLQSNQLSLPFLLLLPNTHSFTLSLSFYLSPRCFS